MNDKSLFNRQIGEKLRKLRKANKKSQATVGSDFSLSQDTISEIELGKRPLDAFELASFSRYYEKSIVYFFMNSKLN